MTDSTSREKSVWINPELHLRLKRRALDEGTTMRELVERALEKILQNPDSPGSDTESH